MSTNESAIKRFLMFDCTGALVFINTRHFSVSYLITHSDTANISYMSFSSYAPPLSRNNCGNYSMNIYEWESYLLANKAYCKIIFEMCKHA